jgi:hypothetical protein
MERRFDYGCEAAVLVLPTLPDMADLLRTFVSSSSFDLAMEDRSFRSGTADFTLTHVVACKGLLTLCFPMIVDWVACEG